jgi:hypothetical protein
VLAPDRRIVRTRVVNPVHPGSFESQAGIRLDIQVTDEQGRRPDRDAAAASSRPGPADIVRMVTAVQ